jgi:uncharacterized protein related to proFAR isomerase
MKIIWKLDIGKTIRRKNKMRTVEELKEKSHEVVVKRLERKIIEAMEEDECSVSIDLDDLEYLQNEILDAGFEIIDGIICWK